MPATPKMIRFAKDLLAERDLTAHPSPAFVARLQALAATPAQVERLPYETMRTLLDCLTGLPYLSGPDSTTAELPDAQAVPAGRYAIPTLGEDAVNTLAFYKVDRPTEGRWAGYVFVKHMLSDEERRVPKAQSAGILARIAEYGAEKASSTYGHEIGACGLCGRTLTNDESRSRGIGPICASKAGW